MGQMIVAVQLGLLQKPSVSQIRRKKGEKEGKVGTLFVGVEWLISLVDSHTQRRSVYV